jgi:hypothetical protein
MCIWHYTVIRRLTMGQHILRNASLGNFVIVRTSKSVLTQTWKPGVDSASLWMKVLPDIRFHNREVSPILKIRSGK